MFRVYYTRTPSFVLLSGEIQTLQMKDCIRENRKEETELYIK